MTTAPIATTDAPAAVVLVAIEAVESAPLCCECVENPVLVDDLWGELEVCEDCNDGTPDDPADVTTPGEVWGV